MFLNKALAHSLLLLALSGFMSPLLADESLAMGETLFKQQCVACHGASAEGNASLKAPKIAGLSDWYLKNQLNGFKSGYRGTAKGDNSGAMMAGASQNLSDPQISALASYIGSLKSTTPTQSTVKGDLLKGQQFYESLCGSCHGPGGKGNQALNSPKLSGLNDWYLVEQIQKFRSGQRGFHADDRLGRQMKMMSNILPDDEAIKDVASYLSAQ